jgi:amidase
MAPMYQKIAAIAQKRRDDALNAYFPIPDIADEDLPLDLRSYPRTSGLLSAEELDIINSDAGTLLQQMKDRKLTAFAVTSAFCKAAAIAQKLV